MKREEVIQKFGELTPAQTLASLFHDRCLQYNKKIEFSHASASVYINSYTSQEEKLLKQLQKPFKNKILHYIYPHGNQLEVWFI